jgi:signal transduction histidine kinase
MQRRASSSTLGWVNTVARRTGSRPAGRPLTTAFGWRLPDWLLDYGPLVFILIEGFGAIHVESRVSHISAAGLALALLASLAALLARHRSPVVVLGVVLGIAVAVDYGPVVTLPVLLAIFTVAEYEDRTTVVAAAAVAALSISVAPWVHGDTLTAGGIISRFVAVGLAVAVGLWLRARADYVTGLHERAERLEREQELMAQHSVAEERLRIARELHDVVAHNVSLMVVQAQALAATGGGDHEQQTSLTRMADLGREALSEMHRMLGVLRVKNAGAPEREPNPGVRDLERLIARTREAGLAASLIVDGTVRELPPGVDLSVYRIVQEALTNVIRHAAARQAVVTLSYSEDALGVTVLDDGIGPPAGLNGSSGGHGLLGMRERVALFGGHLETGLGAEGAGYRVHASLPLH